MAAQLPQEFIDWLYTERAEIVRRMMAGERIPKEQLYLSFTRHNPAVITSGPGGLNGSIKGVGFVPKEEYAQEFLELFMEHINKGQCQSYAREGLALLYRLIYSEEARERLDFNRLGSLELACKHTWTNILAEPKATLLFYEPPSTSYEVRCRVEIHREGVYHALVNAMHDAYHGPEPSCWSERPVYIFIIEEIYDNSVTPQWFGRKIYP